MTEDIKYDLIERYLSNELSEEEQDDFKKKLVVDKGLQDEVNLHLQVTETLKGEKVHELRSALKKVDEKWEAPNRQQEPKIVFFTLKKILAVAAVFLLVILAYQLFSPTKQTSTEALFASNFEPYKMILNQRTIDPETGAEVNEINQAVAAYERKEFAKASELFQALQEQTPTAGIFQLYTAVSELSLNNSDKSISILKEIIAAASPLVIEQSQWYLALAYLKKGDTELAKSTLQKIEKNSFKYNEAQIILEDL